MKSLFAFGLPVVFVAASALPAAGQVGSQNALGGKFLSPGMSRPLGGISPGATGRRPGWNTRAGGSVYALPYAYSFYIPNYFDTSGAAYSYDNAAPAPPPQAPAPPVIINQYFGAPPPQSPPPDVRPSNDAQTPGDSLAPADNYYLIAYKNHSVYTALAFWVEDKTLHYVTTGNTHNQASLDLIDLDLTKTLNQARGVPFAIAGR